MSVEKIGLKFNDREIVFAVEVTAYEGCENDHLVHVLLIPEQHDKPKLKSFNMDARRVLELRVMSCYQAFEERARQRLVVRNESLLRRTFALVNIRLAFPQDKGYLETRRFSDYLRCAGIYYYGKTRADGARSISFGADGDVEAVAPKFLVECGYNPVKELQHLLLGISADSAGRSPEIAPLAGQQLTEEQETQYANFESDVRHEWDQICEREQNLHKRLHHMRLRLRSMQKDENQKPFLFHVLRDACWLQYCHMYSHVIPHVLRQLKKSGVLDGPSFEYNRLVHSPDNRFGGVIPVHHPMWDFFIRHREFVTLLRRQIDAPADTKALDRVNSAMAILTHAYSAILALGRNREKGKRLSVSFLDPNVIEETTSIQTQKNERRDILERLDSVRNILSKDDNKVLDEWADHQTYEVIAKKRGHTKSWVPKKVERLLRSLKDADEREQD